MYGAKFTLFCLVLHTQIIEVIEIIIFLPFPGTKGRRLESRVAHQKIEESEDFFRLLSYYFPQYYVQLKMEIWT